MDPGIPDYNLLNQSYIIMITPFDLFGYGKYRYTFVSKCLEEQVKKKLAKGKTTEEIADALEESMETIEELIENMNHRT